MVILTFTPVEDGLTGTSSNEVLAIFSSTFQRFVIRLSLYFQGQQKLLNMKRQKVDSTVFFLTMDTGSCVVARLPTGISGPPRLTTNSEVATITYCMDYSSCLML